MNLPGPAGAVAAGVFAAGADAAAAVAIAGCAGGVAGSLIVGAAGVAVAMPFGAVKACDSIVTLAGCRPSLFARTVILPGLRVARTATRLMPASKSRNGLLIELILPLS